MSFLYIVHVVVCVVLTTVILFQDGKTGGLGSIPDAGNSVFGAKGASNFLTNLTSILAVVFMVLSLGLAYQNSGDARSIAADHVPATSQSSGEITTPAGGTAPADKPEATQENKSLDVDGAESAEVIKGDLPPEVKQTEEEIQRRAAEKKDQEDGENQ